jgi:hypothetical protein
MVIGALVVLYLFMTSGGPEAFGEWMGGQMHIGPTPAP